MAESLLYIQNLDLDYLVARLVTKENWEKKAAVEATRRYKNFLILIYKNPGIVTSPTFDIDAVWHAHILHTKKYTHDCNIIFGKYLHHTPSTDMEEEQAFLERASRNFSQLYTQEFGESYFDTLNVSSFW